MAETFTWWKRTLTYADSPPPTRTSERAVEIACALDWLRKRTGNGLEFGNVLRDYGVDGHAVVDPRDMAEGVENMDVFDITFRADWVVSISAIEHVRWDDLPIDPTGAQRAIAHLRGCIREGGAMLITAPMGYNPHLDQAILDREIHTVADCTFVREGDEWRQTPVVQTRPYGQGQPWAAAVWVAEIDSARY